MTIRKNNKIPLQECPLLIECLFSIFKSCKELLLSIVKHCPENKLFVQSYMPKYNGSAISLKIVCLEFLNIIAELNTQLGFPFDEKTCIELFIEVHFYTHSIRKDDLILFKENEDEWIELYNDVVGDHSSKCIKSKTMELIETISNKTDFGMSMYFNLCLRLLNAALGLGINEDSLFKSLSEILPADFLAKISQPVHA